MSFEQWVRDNLVIDKYGDAIDWGNDTFTEINKFVEMFKDVTQDAIDSDGDVRQVIADNDNGRGFKKLILN